MDQQSKTFVFLGAIFIAVLLITAVLTFFEKVSGDLFGQAVVGIIGAVAGLLAPSAISSAKPLAG